MNDDLTVDGNGAGAGGGTLAIGNSHHIRIKNSEIMNSPNQGILVAWPGVEYNEFVNLDIHHNGVNRFDHGIYIQTRNNIVEGSTIHHNAGWGIHNYGGDPSYNIYRDNVVTDNDQAQARATGIGIYTGTDIQVYGNTVSGSYIGIAARATNVDVSRNIVFGNSGVGIVVSGAPVVLADNLVFDNPRNVWFDFDTVSTL